MIQTQYEYEGEATWESGHYLSCPLSPLGPRQIDILGEIAALACICSTNLRIHSDQPCAMAYMKRNAKVLTECVIGPDLEEEAFEGRKK
jgi:hypothetical protein